MTIKTDNSLITNKIILESVITVKIKLIQKKLKRKHHPSIKVYAGIKYAKNGLPVFLLIEICIILAILIQRKKQQELMIVKLLNCLKNLLVLILNNYAKRRHPVYQYD